jgi:MYXO-CTERM domain-containing protein
MPRTAITLQSFTTQGGANSALGVLLAGVGLFAWRRRR